MIQEKMSKNLPDTERLSMLAASILLTYALTRFVSIPGREFAIQLPGLYLSVIINIRTIVVLLIALLTATGADWLMRDHPKMKGRNTFEHWFLPALTAWVIGFPIFELPFGPLWLGSFIVGGILLMLVLIAEYITIDPDDYRQPIASTGLTAVSFALYLALIVSMRFIGFRLILTLPIVFLASILVSLRTFHLRLHGQWRFYEATCIALISGQISTAIHYIPIAAMSYGLALLGVAYALTNLIANLIEEEPIKQAITEPLVMIVILWGMAFWLR